MAERWEVQDLRSHDEIIDRLAQTLARADEPRNAIDVMGIPIKGIAPKLIVNIENTIPAEIR